MPYMSNSYTIETTDGSRSITILAGSSSGNVAGSATNDTDLLLYGRGSFNWGEGIEQNLIRLTENWASPAENPNAAINAQYPVSFPVNSNNGIVSPLMGQTWFNKSNGRLYTNVDGLNVAGSWRLDAEGRYLNLATGGTVNNDVRIQSLAPSLTLYQTLANFAGNTSLVFEGTDSDSNIVQTGSIVSDNVDNSLVLINTDRSDGSISTQFALGDGTIVTNANIIIDNSVGTSIFNANEINFRTDPTEITMAIRNVQPNFPDTAPLVGIDADVLVLSRVESSIVENELKIYKNFIETHAISGKIRTPATLIDDHPNTVLTLQSAKDNFVQQNFDLDFFDESDDLAARIGFGDVTDTTPAEDSLLLQKWNGSTATLENTVEVRSDFTYSAKPLVVGGDNLDGTNHGSLILQADNEDVLTSTHRGDISPSTRAGIYFAGPDGTVNNTIFQTNDGQALTIGGNGYDLSVTNGSIVSRQRFEQLSIPATASSLSPNNDTAGRTLPQAARVAHAVDREIFTGTMLSRFLTVAAPGSLVRQWSSSLDPNDATVAPTASLFSTFRSESYFTSLYTPIAVVANGILRPETLPRRVKFNFSFTWITEDTTATESTGIPRFYRIALEYRNTLDNLTSEFSDWSPVVTTTGSIAIIGSSDNGSRQFGTYTGSALLPTGADRFLQVRLAENLPFTPAPTAGAINTILFDNIFFEYHIA